MFRLGLASSAAKRGALMMNSKSLRAIDARCLSSPAGPGSGDRDSMVEFMRAIAQKRDAAGEQKGTLWSKLKNEKDKKKGNRAERDGPMQAGQQVVKGGKGAKIFNDRGSGGKARPKRSKGGEGWRGKETSVDDMNFQTSRRGKVALDNNDDDDDIFDFSKYQEGEDDDFDGEEMPIFEGEEDDERDDNEGMPKITDLDARMLGFSDSFRKMATSGQGIDISGMDPLDQFLAHAFTEAYKSEDDSFRTVITRPGGSRVKVPITRSLAQLKQYCEPPMLLNSPADSNGAKLAAEAWGVIHQNYFYRDSEKYRLVEKIASLQNKLELAIQRNAESEDEPELLFDPKFRKGDDYLEEELELQRITGVPVKVDTSYVQGETDWTVEAVVDEDQL